MLELRDLHSFYGRSHVIQGISLRVGRGDGVGKTTTLKSIMGAGPRTKGQIMLEDRELRGPAHARARRGLGFVPDGEAVFPDMTVEENIRTGALLKQRGDHR